MLLQEAATSTVTLRSPPHQTLANGPLFVSRHRDVGGRYCVSFVRISGPAMQDDGPPSPFGGVIPVAALFADNERTSYKKSAGRGTRRPTAIRSFLGGMRWHIRGNGHGTGGSIPGPDGDCAQRSNRRDLLLSDQALGGRKRPMDDGWNGLRNTPEEPGPCPERSSMCDINRNMRRFTGKPTLQETHGPKGSRIHGLPEVRRATDQVQRD